jgi:hypothetical protein
MVKHSYLILNWLDLAKLEKIRLNEDIESIFD